ncbi:MAG: hypothetical protein KatS3mg031_1472 [Chitinophagales bacterium]|nr:MAG: hypothetical protein KatS3mg031_1472 [Chitinophagales bacterium]
MDNDNTSRVTLQNIFIAYIKEKGRRPKTIKEFCAFTCIEPRDFKTHYKTFASLECDLWNRWFEETMAVLENSTEYQTYNAREKLLAFYYTWQETIQDADSYLRIAPVLTLYSAMDWFLTDLEVKFLQYAEKLIQLATKNREIVQRPFITDYYKHLLWHQFLFIMNYRIRDKSAEHAKTDEAIERSVNLFFELTGRTQADAIFEFGKFLFTGNA